MMDYTLRLIEENKRLKCEVLDLGNCGLIELPIEIESLNHLKELRLGSVYYDADDQEWKSSLNTGNDNSITNLDSSILSKLISLKILQISYLNIISLSFASEILNLEFLYAKSNNISEIPLINNSNLLGLDVSFNELNNIENLKYIHSLKYLNISHNNIDNIRPIVHLKDILRLDVSYNKIDKIPHFQFLTNLIDLRINDNKIEKIDAIYPAVNLSILDISSNPIEDIIGLGVFTNLYELNCSDIKTNSFNIFKSLDKLNKINIGRNIIQETDLYLIKNSVKNLTIYSVKELNIVKIEEFTNLLYLDISFNDISNMSFIQKFYSLKQLRIIFCKNLRNFSFLSSLKHLTVLELSNTRLEDLSPIASLTNLEDLNVSSNLITDISSIGNLINLKKLDLSSNKIINIKSLKRLKLLKELNLGYNDVNNLEPIKELKSLTTLSLAKSNSFIYDIIDHLPNIEKLDIRDNDLKNADFLKRYNKLRSLDLSGNDLEDISFMSSLENLGVLHLSGNRKIKSFESISKLYKVYSLSLENCALTKVCYVKDLINLGYLNLANNKITDISDVSPLVKLHALDVHNNEISDIAPLVNLKNIDHLNLCNNKIRNIPYEFFKNIDLDWVLDDPFDYLMNCINLTGNDLDSPPLSVILQGKDFLNEYYKSASLKSINECKIILVGRGKVGKTSLQKRLTGGQFEPNEPETHGIRKVSWNNSIRDNKNNFIKVNIWDFGGQYIQQTLHQFFYTPNTVYVLVLDKRIDEDPEDFLELIKIYGASSPVIIVYNHLINLENDNNPQYDLSPEIDSSLRNKYPNIQSKSFGVCCGFDNDNGINLLRIYLTKLIPILDHVTQEYPVSWLNLKDSLVSLVKENYIEFSKYLEICQAKSISGKAVQQDLAKMLNNIGAITFFNKKFLGHYYILNPEWITTGVYQIILSTHTDSKKGRINIEDLDIILSSNLPYKYKTEEYYFLLQLMQTFDLCHQFSENEWVIPSSLEGQSSTDLTNYKSDTHRLYYLEYEVSLPGSIIHRFIARNISFSYQNDYWRNGIVVKHPFSNTFIYVESDRKDKQIRLWIKGENIRDCWEYFRKDFKEFSNTFAYREFVSLDSLNKSKISYQSLLASLNDSVLKFYMPEYGNVDVLDTLGLFSDIRNIESIKNMAEGQDKTKIENHFHGGMNISQVGTIGSSDNSSNNFSESPTTNTEKLVKVGIDVAKEKLQNEYKDQQVAKWRLQGWMWTFAFSILTLVGLIWVMNQVNWSFDLNSTGWKKITSNSLYVLSCAIIGILINGLFLKSLYDKYKSHSNIKAFREMIKLPENLK